jgi:hypothetical protein
LPFTRYINRYAIKILIFICSILKLKRSHCGSTDYIVCKTSKLHHIHPRTQGLFGKDPGIVWSRDSTKINCPRGSGKVSNYMLENVTANFKYQEWDFTIHRSKRSLTSILHFCLLLNYKSTVAFYQQSSQETNKSYTLIFKV